MLVCANTDNLLAVSLNIRVTAEDITLTRIAGVATAAIAVLRRVIIARSKSRAGATVAVVDDTDATFSDVGRGAVLAGAS